MEGWRIPLTLPRSRVNLWYGCMIFVGSFVNKLMAGSLNTESATLNQIALVISAPILLIGGFQYLSEKDAKAWGWVEVVRLLVAIYLLYFATFTVYAPYCFRMLTEAAKLEYNTKALVLAPCAVGWLISFTVLCFNCSSLCCARRHRGAAPRILPDEMDGLENFKSKAD